MIAPGCACETVPEKLAGSPKITSDFPKRRESDDKNAVAIVKSVSQLGCVSQDSDAVVSQCRKSRGSPMQKVLEPIQRVRFTESTLRQAQQRCARSKAWNLAKHIHKLKEKDKAAFYFPRRNGYSRLRQRKRRRKESL